jgi:hypothetical protein
MSGNAPSDFYPELTDSRLRIIGTALLDVLYETELELDTPLDDGYTRGTATFGRQRNAIIQLCQSGKYEWLKLTNAGMDVTFEVGGIPCRFFADDPQNPKKPGFFRRNDCDKLFPTEVGRPELMRFIVAKPHTPDEEADVHFIGFDANLDEVFNWQHSRSTPVIASTDDALPREVDIPPARAKLPRSQKDKDQAVGDFHDPQE